MGCLSKCLGGEHTMFQSCKHFHTSTVGPFNATNQGWMCEFCQLKVGIKTAQYLDDIGTENHIIFPFRRSFLHNLDQISQHEDGCISERCRKHETKKTCKSRVNMCPQRYESPFADTERTAAATWLVQQVLGELAVNVAQMTSAKELLG